MKLYFILLLLTNTLVYKYLVKRFSDRFEIETSHYKNEKFKYLSVKSFEKNYDHDKFGDFRLIL